MASGRDSVLQSRRLSSEDNELELLSRITAKDRSAFATLYEAYRPRLFQFLQRMVDQRDLADEIVNDVLFVVWTDAGRFSGRSRVSTWILGIAYRKALKALRSVRRHANRVQPDAVADLSSGEEASREEIQDWLHAALSELSPEQRLVVEFTYYGGCSYQEIAEIAGCPVNTVKTRMFHAKKKLQQILPALSSPRSTR